MTIPEVIGQLLATAARRAEISGQQDSSALLALAMADAVQKLYSAAVETLEANRHLADGEQCTLLRLRRSLE